MSDSCGDADRSRRVLVPAQGGMSDFLLCLDARHAAPLPLRPTHGFRVEIPIAGVSGKSGGHKLRGPGIESMMLPYILFFVFAGIAVIGALLVIFMREPIHSALALILVMV